MLAAFVLGVLWIYLAWKITGKIIAPLEEADRLQKEFVLFAGHELKTPVTVMKASLDMLEREGIHSKYLDYAAEENEKMRKLVIELLDYSKMEYQEEKSFRESVNFSQCIEGISLEFEAMAFEYYLDTDYEFNTDFQKNLAEYLSQEYMEYINDQNLRVSESAVDIDINGDGDKDDVVDLTIEYDGEKYADDWTWFDSDGNALSDESVSQLSTEEKAQAFLEGRYAKGESGQNAGPGGGMPDGNGPDGNKMPGEMLDGIPDRNGSDGEKPEGAPAGSMPGRETSDGNAQDDLVTSGMGDEVGTPDAGTTQSAGTKTDSSNYSSYEEMLESYESDIASIEDGDKYGNNIVDLYNPINYIGDEDTESPTWTRIVMGASEGDMSLFASMNMQIAWLNSGTDAKLEWQWDGGHVPSEIFGESLALYVDEMYGQYIEGTAEVTKAEAQTQTENGTATEATGTDISSWVSYENGEVNFTLKDIVAYRTKGASKATPGFDVVDYGQETYEFGSSTQDARHFDKYVLKVLQENAETLSELFNSEEK